MKSAVRYLYAFRSECLDLLFCSRRNNFCRPSLPGE